MKNKFVIIGDPYTSVIGGESKHYLVVSKGGQGSGNFGHIGRPGKVGGSSSGNTVLEYGTYDDFANSIHTSADTFGYWIDGDGTLLAGSGDYTTHTPTIAKMVLNNDSRLRNVSELNSQDAKDVLEHDISESQTLEQVGIDSGLVKVRISGIGTSSVEVTIRTSDITQSSVRRLQRLYERGIIPLADTYRIYGDNGAKLVASMDDFLNGKRLVEFYEGANKFTLKQFPIHSIPPSNFHPKSMRIKVVSR